MRYLWYSVLLLAACPVLVAQEETVNHAVAFPSTTIAYAEADVTALRDASGLMSSVEDLIKTFGGPGLHDYLSEFMRFQLTESESRDMMSGINKLSAGLLDVGISGPRWQLVIEGEDFSAAERAVAHARANNAGTVPEATDHFGTTLYQVRLRPLRRDFEVQGWGRSRPTMDLPEVTWVAFVGQRFLVVSSSQSAVGDAVDALHFPDDDFDTLAGNRRYRSGTSDFDAAQMLMFINAPAARNAVERLGEGGAQMMGGIMVMILLEMFAPRADGPEAEFFASLMQYEQINCWAAALWYDPDNATVKVDTVTDYINTPEWAEAIRVEPKRRRAHDLLPHDALLAFSQNVDDAADSYRRLREFVLTRARNAGLQDIVDGWREFDNEGALDGVQFEEILSYLNGEQSVFLVPTATFGDVDPYLLDLGVEVALVLEVGDVDATETFLHDKIQHYKHLRWFFSSVNDELAPVEYIDGIEVRASSDRSLAIAVVPSREDGNPGGYVVAGQYEAVKRILEAADAETERSEAWINAESLLHPESTSTMMLNTGRVVQFIATAISGNMFRWGDDEDPEPWRDDTQRDDDPMPYVSELLKYSVVLSSQQDSGNRSIMRFVMGGIPSENEVQKLITYIDESERNRQVRDDLLRVLDAAEAHYILHGGFAESAEALANAGLLGDPDDIADAFILSERQTYALVKPPEDADVRQPILLAHQRNPGLRGNHLAVLWNGDVIELTPEQLEDAIERAREGKTVAAQGYSPVRPLHMQDLSEGTRIRFQSEDVVIGRPAPEAEVVEVVVIDEEGNEEKVNVGAGEVEKGIENALDRRREENDD
jgi:hypothetical protein